MDWLRTARSRQVIAAVLVTAVTAILIGVILIAATPLGCGPANVFGLKSISSKCYRPLAVASPSPLATQSASSSPSPSPSPTPVSSPSPLPSATTPDTGPATAAYPPFYPGATGSNGVITPARTLNCRLPVFAGPPYVEGAFSVVVGYEGQWLRSLRRAVAPTSRRSVRPCGIAGASRRRASLASTCSSRPARSTSRTWPRAR